MLLAIAMSGCVQPQAGTEVKGDGDDQYAAAESPLAGEDDVVKFHTVEIKGMQFVPEVLTVNKGDTVIWINRDIVDHDVTEQDSNSWTSGKMVPGSSWKMTVAKSGDYYCSIHVVMKGRLVVKTEKAADGV